MGDLGDAARWYPEVVAAGDACEAWRAAFGRHGVPFEVRPRGGAAAHRIATAANGELRADLLLSPRERRFSLSLRAGRNVLLQGRTADLAATAGAAGLWLSGARPGAVAAAWPFLGSVALAEARERGDRAEAGWLWLAENHTADPVAARLRAFVALAFHEPRLRVLLPYTSHVTLTFSSTPRWPFTRDHPLVIPAAADDRFRVRPPGGLVSGEVDAAGALRLVADQLPR